jgi:hypothetical protein
MSLPRLYNYPKSFFYVLAILTVSRLEQQRVPIVIEKTSFHYEESFPIVAEFVRSRYAEAPIGFDSMRDYRVMVDTRLTPTGTYPSPGTPCYR